MTREKIPLEWLERIFKRFHEIYGQRYKEHCGKTDVDQAVFRTVWYSAIGYLNQEEIKRGLNQCKTRALWPPVTPVQFWHLAKGLPVCKKKAFPTPRNGYSTRYPRLP